MAYNSTLECVKDLELHGQLIRWSEEVDPYLELAEIQRRLYKEKAPAVLFENVKGTEFPVLCNLYGTMERTRFIFRDTLEDLSKFMDLKKDPTLVRKNPWHYLRSLPSLRHALPKKLSPSKAPSLWKKTTIDKLPGLVSWPMDGGPFITLPQVYSEGVEKNGPMNSNLGMYRVQMSGNDFVANKEMGIHYQIHRGIGIHQKEHLEAGKDLKVSIFVGGPPASTFAAVMPLPEGMPEVAFAGFLNGSRWRYAVKDGFTYAADADFVITGTIRNKTKPEGPFGDHLGYYSLTHDFPLFEVEDVYHREGAIWNWTVVGRPPQEDTSFGELIHEMTGPAIPAEIPGLQSIHAVDAAGVHPLLFAIGSERYTPYSQVKRPQELLTLANAILGKGQLSLAKYLLISDNEEEGLDIHDPKAFIEHILARADWKRDLHFQTQTTIDTLDYSGEALNRGSKLVIAACGEATKDLGHKGDKLSLPSSGPFEKIRQAPIDGVLLVETSAFKSHSDTENEINLWTEAFESIEGIESYPLIVLCDDADFAAQELNNFLWVAFTRSNPSHDIYGVRSSYRFKHWGCEGSLIIDARLKPHHAPPLVEDEEVTAKVDKLWPKLKSW